MSRDNARPVHSLDSALWWMWYVINNLFLKIGGMATQMSEFKFAILILIKNRH